MVNSRISRDSLRYAFLEDGAKRALLARFDRLMAAFEMSPAP